MSTSLLRLQDLSKAYGALVALDRVTISVQHGARHAVIGPNGAGKSTLFGLVTGALTPTKGTLHYDGEDITSVLQVRRARRGIAQTFQHSSVFLPSTAFENVAIAAQQALGRSMNVWRPTFFYRDVAERVEESLGAVGLTHRRHVLAAELSHGERQQLEVAIALAMRPRLLLLDEPTAGMSVADSMRFTELILSLPSDVTILIIEHDLKVVFALATEVSVLHLGQLLATGSPEEIRANPEVQAAYLGGDVEAPLAKEIAMDAS